MRDPRNSRYRNRMEARQRAVREAHGLVVESGGVAGRVPRNMVNWAYDLRRGRLTIYGGLLRFIDLSAETGTPREIIERIPAIIAAYIADIYTDNAA